MENSNLFHKLLWWGQGGYPLMIMENGYVWSWKCPCHSCLAVCMKTLMIHCKFSSRLYVHLQMKRFKNKYLQSLKYSTHFWFQTLSNWAKIQFTWLHFVKKFSLLEVSNSFHKLPIHLWDPSRGTWKENLSGSHMILFGLWTKGWIGLFIFDNYRQVNFNGIIWRLVVESLQIKSWNFALQCCE